jgi:hypothetical protein|tara:strand:+ start:533 stop:865 length:333 start_codon:yes stop_codon:yes gene_type:complete
MFLARASETSAEVEKIVAGSLLQIGGDILLSHQISGPAQELAAEGLSLESGKDLRTGRRRGLLEDRGGVIRSGRGRVAAGGEEQEPGAGNGSQFPRFHLEARYPGGRGGL